MKCLITIFLLFSVSLHAFESTNIQLLYSNSFDGDAFIYDTKDGKKTTVTFEHFRTYSLGDFFMFADIMDGKKFNDKDSEIYMEFAPRVSFSKLLKNDFSTSIVKDIFIATQTNYGDDYRAYLYGLGVDFNIPLLNMLSLNVYNKTENIFTNDTYQITLVYASKSFYGLFIEGFVDITRRDLNTHNRLLYNVSKYLGTKEKIDLGIEWIYYDDKANGTSSKTSAVQGMIKYSF